MNYKILYLLSITSCAFYGNEPIFKELKLASVDTISLKSNPASTGYSWYLITPINKNSKIQIINSGYNRPQTNLIGASGKQFWQVKAVKRGTQSLLFEKRRPWEENVPAIETQKVIINIQ